MMQMSQTIMQHHESLTEEALSPCVSKMTSPHLYLRHLHRQPNHLAKF